MNKVYRENIVEYKRRRDQISCKQRIIHPGAGTKILFLDTLAWIQLLYFKLF